jgi:hypothetical protein
MMSASFVHHQKPNARLMSVLSPFLRHLNPGTLALIMFVAFALLSTTRGKDAETRESALAGTTKSEMIIDERHNDGSNVVTEPSGQTISAPPTLWQFMRRIVNTFEGAFNDASLIEYGKQQGIDISDSLTTPCPNSSQPISTPSKPLLNQSSKPSSTY